MGNIAVTLPGLCFYSALAAWLLEYESEWQVCNEFWVATGGVRRGSSAGPVVEIGLKLSDSWKRNYTGGPLLDHK